MREQVVVALGVIEERQEVTFCSWVLRITVELVFLQHSNVYDCLHTKLAIDTYTYT